MTTGTIRMYFSTKECDSGLISVPEMATYTNEKRN